MICTYRDSKCIDQALVRTKLPLDESSGQLISGQCLARPADSGCGCGGAPEVAIRAAPHDVPTHDPHSMRHLGHRGPRYGSQDAIDDTLVRGYILGRHHR